MNRSRFQKLLDRYGGDLMKWPEAERRALKHAALGDVEAHEVMEQARVLDRLIQHALEDDAYVWGRDAAAARVLARLSRNLPDQRPDFLSRMAAWKPMKTVPWPSVAALGFAAGLGIAVGFFSADPQTTVDRWDRVAALDDGDADLNAVLFDTETFAGSAQ